jgi:hypothetical protein
MTPSIILATYSGILSSISPMFSRPNSYAGSYYYQTIQVTVYTTGTYTFTSTSSIDTYGCFYEVPFDPSYPSENLITYDDDSAGNGQFRISRSLQSFRTYVLVVTTWSNAATGSFLITAVGPALVGFTSITPSTSMSTTASTITIKPTSE